MNRESKILRLFDISRMTWSKNTIVLNQLKLPTHWNNGTKLDPAPYSKLLRHPQIPLVFLIQPWYTNPAESQRIPLKDPSSMGWIWSDLKNVRTSFGFKLPFQTVLLIPDMFHLLHCWISQADTVTKHAQHIWAADSGDFYLFCCPSKENLQSPRPGFNLVSQVLGTFPPRLVPFSKLWHQYVHKYDSHQNLSRFCSPPHLVWISFCRRNQHFLKPCLTPHLLFIKVNKCSCWYTYSNPLPIQAARASISAMSTITGHILPQNTTMTIPNVLQDGRGTRRSCSWGLATLWCLIQSFRQPIIT